MRGDVLIPLVVLASGTLFLYDKGLKLEAARERRIERAETYQQQRQCAEDSRRWADDYLKAESAGPIFGRLIWDDPEFHLSAESGACLVRTRSVNRRPCGAASMSSTVPSRGETGRPSKSP